MIAELEELFERQTGRWPLFARGLQGLALAKTRPVRVDWFDVFIRHIPHRAASTTAAVDPESIAGRPCFLCARNMPVEEEGLQFGDYTIYCNPFPVVERHLTIVHREHRPQRIAGELQVMLELAAALPGYFIIYNGPECGASAPDHMHFQAGARSLFPIEQDTSAWTERPFQAVTNYARSVFLFRGRERPRAADQISRTLELLAQVGGKAAEPMVNLAAFHERGEWVIYLFPRKKHRPEVFYTGELTVSPASIDLCGILVVPFERDFEKITGQDTAAIFREVTMADDQFREIAARLESAS